MAIEHPEVPAAIRPHDSTAQARSSRSTRALVLGGVGIFLVGIALLVVAISFFAGGIR